MHVKPQQQFLRWLQATALALTVTAVASGCGGDKPTPSVEACTGVNAGRVVCGDFGNTLGTVDNVFVSGRLVQEEPGFNAKTSAPSHDLEQDELANEEVQLRLVDATEKKLATFTASTDDDGWLAERLDLGAYDLSPGEYLLEVNALGSFATTLQLRLLRRNYDDLVVLSDIDLTYLNTDFQSTAAIADLLEQEASERETLPGMERVYQQLRAGASGNEDRPLVFLSGSPLFFRRTLAAKAELDDVADDGILLKPLKQLLIHELLEGFDTSDVLDALLGDTDAILGSLTDQLGYKLTAALAQQLNLPVDTGLLLLGDDSESDHIVYALFHRYLNREIDDEALSETLDDLGVDDVWRDAIAVVGPAVLSARGTLPSPVQAVFINQTAVPNTQEPASNWAIAGLSRHHQGAWPLVLELYEEGWVSREGVITVGERLLAQGQSSTELETTAAAGVEAGFLEAASAKLLP